MFQGQSGENSWSSSPFTPHTQDDRPMGSNADLELLFHLSSVEAIKNTTLCKLHKGTKGLGRRNLMLTKMVLRITPKNEGQTEASVVHWAEPLPALF